MSNTYFFNPKTHQKVALYNCNFELPSNFQAVEATDKVRHQYASGTSVFSHITSLHSREFVVVNAFNHPVGATKHIKDIASLIERSHEQEKHCYYKVVKDENTSEEKRFLTLPHLKALTSHYSSYFDCMDDCLEASAMEISTFDLLSRLSLLEIPTHFNIYNMELFIRLYAFFGKVANELNIAHLPNNEVAKILRHYLNVEFHREEIEFMNNYSFNLGVVEFDYLTGWYVRITYKGREVTFSSLGQILSEIRSDIKRKEKQKEMIKAIRNNTPYEYNQKSVFTKKEPLENADEWDDSIPF